MPHGLHNNQKQQQQQQHIHLLLTGGTGWPPACSVQLLPIVLHGLHNKQQQ
jgi:hypothetical protein